jgi:preprotein translocase subunit SecA
VIISLEDEIFHGFFQRHAGWLRRIFRQENKPLPTWLGQAIVGFAQRAAERHHGGIRRDLLRADDQLSDMLAFTGRSE